MKKTWWEFHFLGWEYRGWFHPRFFLTPRIIWMSHYTSEVYLSPAWPRLHVEWGFGTIIFEKRP